MLEYQIDTFGGESSFSRFLVAAALSRFSLSPGSPKMLDRQASGLLFVMELFHRVTGTDSRR